AVISTVLLPLYYKLNLTSIYSYLNIRFGKNAYKTGSVYFLISRIIGASFRMFLVVSVLQVFVFDYFNIPFWVTVSIFMLLIQLYTIKGGIKTIIWTDTLQTTFMLIAVITTIFIIVQHLDTSLGNAISTVWNSDISDIIITDINSKQNFVKLFLSGIFITIVMTGLDQDMMQKNLSYKNLKASQKNMYSFVLILVAVNFLFLLLGSGLYLYAEAFNVAIPDKSDLLFPTLALTHFPVELAIVFVLGLLASAYSSADSALTSLTTSFYLDILEKEEDGAPKQRQIIHLGFSLLVFALVVLFYYHMQTNAIDALLKAASYTYGPLLGLFTFGIFNSRKPHDRWIPWIAIAAPILSYLLATYGSTWLGGYQFGYEILLINGGLVYLGLWLSCITKNKSDLLQST
ncbi:MAG: sodium:solute symporter, partial [Proteobacteria bacterium]|nr:sodium:solute symporter [Pseudomonadota bacterium]